MNQSVIFFGKTTERFSKFADTNKGAKSRRSFSFRSYFFNGEERVRVCRDFYLKTLDISAKRIEYYHSTIVDTKTAIARPFRRGKNVKRCTDPRAVQGVIDHISNFPRVESHYCRASTQRQYLDPNLSVDKMYRMYRDDYANENVPPVKLHKYRDIFNKQFNLSFSPPVKDRCDFCEQFRVQTEPSDADTLKYNKHCQQKISTKQERDSDRAVVCDKHAIISFDLQNVISLPKANIKSFWFNRKLSVYNLTVHYNICQTKGRICVIWYEGLRGRSGNDLASALVAALNYIVDLNPAITKITLWSDACIAQNKNSAMSLALIKFLEAHQVEQIIQKFGTPGHSPVQEVDSIHSLIERKILRRNEIYSPIGLIKLLKRDFHVIEMEHEVFHDYYTVAKHMKFSCVPYSKVCELLYTRSDLTKITYRNSFNEEHISVQVANIIGHPRTLTLKPSVSSDKAKDLRTMLKYMSPTDRNFYDILLSNKEELDLGDLNTENCIRNKANASEPSTSRGHMLDSRVTRNQQSHEQVGSTASDGKLTRMLRTSKSKTYGVTKEKPRAMLPDERSTDQDADRGKGRVRGLSSKRKRDTLEADSRVPKKKDATMAKARKKTTKAVKSKA